MHSKSSLLLPDENPALFSAIEQQLAPAQLLTKNTDSLWWFEAGCLNASSAKSLFSSTTWSTVSTASWARDSLQFLLLLWEGGSPTSGVTVPVSAAPHLWESLCWCWAVLSGWRWVPPVCSSCSCCASRAVLEGRFKHRTEYVSYQLNSSKNSHRGNN